MIRTTTKRDTDLAKLFIFDNPKGSEHNAFMVEVGTLIFQSALIKFLSIQTESKAKIFESFVFLNVTNKNFVGLICCEYPEFENILVVEIKSFQSEIIFN